MGWNWSGMMIACSGSLGRCRLRLLAERTGLRAGLSAAMAREGSTLSMTAARSCWT